jgi:osmoprotectant transport system permease protein
MLGCGSSDRVAFWLALLFMVLLLAMPAGEPLFRHWFPALERPVYTRVPFVELALSHIGLVAASSLVIVILGIAAGAFVTRPMGREFAGIVDTIVTVGQTFPPVAVLAIAVPLTGYGATPTLLALIAYGALPVVATTVTGLRGVPAAVREAADGAGFSPLGRLLQIELPLAAPVILSGIRTSVVISIGTATIGSTVGAVTLGSPIIEGLSGSNPAYVLQGAILVGLLAIAVDQAFEGLQRRMTRHQAEAAV